VQQGVESFFATQRILMDVAMRQNAAAMKALREGLSDPEHSPMALLTELAMEGTASFVEAQKILLNLVQKENEIVTTGVRDRMGAFTPAIAMTELLRRSVDTYVGMQEEFLDIASKHTKGWLEPKGARPDVVETARAAMETFVHAQKKFLDVIAEETERITTGKPMPTRAKKTELSKLAHDAATAYIEAQKKLLDIAGRQMNINMKTISKAMETVTPFRIPLASLTGEGVKSFVDAEKALIDTMMKRGATAHTETHKKTKRTTQSKRAQAVAAAAV
jgi:hypothetical protein